MSPTNRTAKQIAEIRRAIEKGKMEPGAGEKRIKELESAPVVFQARWTLPNGKERTKSFSGKGAEKKALAFEADQRGKVRRREVDDHVPLRATIATILDFYLEKNMAGRESFKNARAHRNDIIEVWGDRLTLERLDRSPDALIEELREALEAKHPSPTTAWNRKVTCQAAINFYLTKNRLRMVNPFTGFDWEQPDNERKVRITLDQHRKLIQTASKPHFPAWVRVFLEEGWETGWRAGEIGDWVWERLELNPPGEQFPWVLTLVQKQRKAKPGKRAAPVYEEKPISFRAAGLLLTLRGSMERGPVWPVKRCMRDRWIHRVFIEAGLDDLTFHDYRRSMKRRMKEAGVSDKDQMDYSGHKTIQMQDRYAFNNREDLEGVLRKLEPGHGRDMNPKSGEI